MKFLTHALLIIGLAVDLASLENVYQKASTGDISTCEDTHAPIYLELGAKQTNVGDMHYSVRYDSMYQALKKACDFVVTGDKPCVGRKAEFNVWAQKEHDGPRTRELFTVNVDDAYWHNNEKIYFLLIGAVAGAFERSAYPDDNCIAVYETTSGGGNGYWHCSTISSVKATLPGGNYMNVSFQTAEARGYFNCWQAIQTVVAYVDGLLPEIALATNQQRPDIYAEAKCV